MFNVNKPNKFNFSHHIILLHASEIQNIIPEEKKHYYISICKIYSRGTIIPLLRASPSSDFDPLPHTRLLSARFSSAPPSSDLHPLPRIPPPQISTPFRAHTAHFESRVRLILTFYADNVTSQMRLDYFFVSFPDIEVLITVSKYWLTRWGHLQLSNWHFLLEKP